MIVSPSLREHKRTCVGGRPCVRSRPAMVRIEHDVFIWIQRMHHLITRETATQKPAWDVEFEPLLFSGRFAGEHAYFCWVTTGDSRVLTVDALLHSLHIDVEH